MQLRHTNRAIFCASGTGAHTNYDCYITLYNLDHGYIMLGNLDIDTTPSCCRILDSDYYFRCPAGSRNRRTSSTVRVLTAEVLPVAVLIVNDYIDLEIDRIRSRRERDREESTTTPTTILDR